MQQTPIDVLKIALAIAIPLGIAALTTWINITIRFAPDAAHAIREAKAIALRVLVWASNLFLLGGLIWQLVWPDPDMRTFVLVILIYSFSLFSAYVGWMLRSVFRLIGKQGDQIGMLTDIVGRLVTNPGLRSN